MACEQVLGEIGIGEMILCLLLSIQVISVLFRKGRDDYGKAWSDLEMELELCFSGQL